MLPPGAVGELWAKGPKVVRATGASPRPPPQTFVDGWLRTGDIARIDEEGFLFILDRAKDMLIRGGENIYCIEVENVALRPSRRDRRRRRRHPAQIAGRRAGRGRHPEARHAGDRGGAARLCRRTHRGFQGTGRILLSRETLPRNANGKILKSELKRLFVA